MKLRKLEISGFKSISSAGQTIPFGEITILLGANGSGKSNVIAALDLLKNIAMQKLSSHVLKHGLNSLLFYGRKKTSLINIKACFANSHEVEYRLRLACSNEGRLFIESENLQSPLNRATGKQGKPCTSTKLPYGENGESALREISVTNTCAYGIYEFLSGLQIYQFNDTSDTARMKDEVYLEDAYGLKHDGANLAAFLRRLKNDQEYEKYYWRIIRHIRSVMPQFDDFVLEPLPGNKRYLRLNWKDSSGNDYIFGPHQLSDGILRFMTMATLLLQPPEFLPPMLVLDEPELGLHHWAITVFEKMLKIASRNSQILIATQSLRLLDEIGLKTIVVVERDFHNNCSIFSSPEVARLRSWLKNYSLSELWEKNVLGGNP